MSSKVCGAQADMNVKCVCEKKCVVKYVVMFAVRRRVCEIVRE